MRTALDGAVDYDTFADKFADDFARFERIVKKEKAIAQRIKRNGTGASS